MSLAGELAKQIGGEIVKNTGKELAIKGGQQAIQRASSDVLRNAITDIVAEDSIDLASKGFGKQILSGLRSKVFNSPASEAQALVDAFPKLYRTDFGIDGNDMICTLKNDGGAVLSGFAKFDNVDTGKGTRRLGISRDSFDRFFKRPENSFLANPKMEVGGSPRTGELYPNNQLRNAQDVLSDLRNKVLDYYTSDPTNEELINSIPNIYGADEYAAGLLEEIAKNNSPINTINEFVNKSVSPLNVKPLIQDKKIIKSKTPVKSANTVSNISKNLHNEHKNTFKRQKVVFSDMALRWSKEAPEKPIEQRIDPEHLETILRKELEKCGINIPFEITLINHKSERVYSSLGFEYVEDIHDYYSQILFPNDFNPKLDLMRVYFPTRDSYIIGQIARFAITSMVITIILFITFAFAILLLLHQRKVNELRTDFMNNMTHEFKTPISSIFI
jgi:hypothetical protein